jgi:molybdopterin-guanine dinucleotide biosynthesis protein A
VAFTREQPPGGGPAAGLVAGLRVALTQGPAAIVVLPGDAPAAGRAVVSLLAALTRDDAVVGVDASGQVQPLQLALRPIPAQRLVELAGPDGAASQSARRLVAQLTPRPVPLASRPGVRHRHA